MTWPRCQELSVLKTLYARINACDDKVSVSRVDAMFEGVSTSAFGPMS